MKKLAALILCVLIFTSCSNRENIINYVQPPIANPPVTTPVTELQPEQKQTEPETPAVSETPEPVGEPVSAPAVQTVNITVYGLDGAIIFSADAEHYEGISALDILLDSAREKNIAVVYTGSKSAAYVTSINGLAEKQHGGQSGWVYTVNGKTVMKPSGKCILSPDDKVVWKYITELSFN